MSVSSAVHPSVDNVARAQDLYTKAAETWSQNVQQWLGRSQNGLQPMVDPVPAIDRYFDDVRRFTDQLVELNRNYAKHFAEAMFSMQSAVREHAQGLAEVSRHQVDAATDLVREQSDDVKAATTAEADAADRAARREAQQARRVARTEAAERYHDLTKTELQHELTRRDLARSGTVDQLRQRLVDADLQAQRA
jgi:hypothetical protein